MAKRCRLFGLCVRPRRLHLRPIGARKPLISTRRTPKARTLGKCQKFEDYCARVDITNDNKERQQGWAMRIGATRSKGSCSYAHPSGSFPPARLRLAQVRRRSGTHRQDWENEPGAGMRVQASGRRQRSELMDETKVAGGLHEQVS
jgi:hypothetical protein